ncbi:MAG: hypothetical protein WD078_02055 [Woeseia sp.]
MNSVTNAVANANLHRIQQVVKWAVYSLLLINFAFYIHEDWDRAVHTLGADASWVDWAGEFATSIDEAGWFLLLFMYELETYVLDDETLKGWVAPVLHGVRIACFVMLAHTVYAYANTALDLRATTPVENAASLCDLTKQDVTYVYNLNYTAVNSDNCASLSDASDFFWLGEDPLVTTSAGLALERELAWVDLAEAVIWLLVIFSIELVVRLQGRGVTGSAVVSTANTAKVLLYLALAGIAIYWATLSHWLYAWDEFVWIAGFATIEMNVNEWRDDLLDNAAGEAVA